MFNFLNCIFHNYFERKIDNLIDQLIEKEIEKLLSNKNYVYTTYKHDDKIENLKNQLAMKDKKIENLKDRIAGYSAHNHRQHLDNCELRKTINSLEAQIEKLKNKS